MFCFERICSKLHDHLFKNQMPFIKIKPLEHLKIIAVFFLSGMSSLAYQIAGGLADMYYALNPAAPLKLYAYSEIFIAVLATLVALILPSIESLSPLFSSQDCSQVSTLPARHSNPYEHGFKI
jgi:hypothetical protein